MVNKNYKNNSSIKNYIETPVEALAENNQNVAKAKYAGETDVLANILQQVGQATMQYGANGGNFGMGGGESGAQFGGEGLSSDTSINFAYGGKTGGQVEIEGNEAVQTPDGQVGLAQGPSHEDGGIGLFLPDGTTIFSDRIKVGGKTMAERKVARTKEMDKINKSLEGDSLDTILSETLKRNLSALEKEDDDDLRVQGLIGAASTGNVGEYALGTDGDGTDENDFFSNMFSGIMTKGKGSQKTLFDDPYGGQTGIELTDELSNQILGKNPSGLNSASGLEASTEVVDTPSTNDTNEVSSNGSSLTGGDVISLAGNTFSALAPLFNTLKSRANDDPNVNAYKDFGQDGLDALDQAQGFIQQQEGKALGDIERSSKTARERARGSARSIQTMRALDLAIEQQAQRSKSDVYSNMAKQMMASMTQKAGLENKQDAVVMQGEQGRDAADRLDEDAYYTAMATNLAGVGQGIQQSGKDLNQVSENDMKQKLLAEMSEYFKFENGELVNKK